MDHLVESDGRGGIITQSDLGQRVADENHVDPGGLGEKGRGVVIGGETGDWRLGCSESVQFVERDFWSSRGS
jgi:hypothetical protein